MSSITGSDLSEQKQTSFNNQLNKELNCLEKDFEFLKTNLDKQSYEACRLNLAVIRDHCLVMIDAIESQEFYENS